MKAHNAVIQGQFGTNEFQLIVTSSAGAALSPWHDLPLQPVGALSPEEYTFVVEIPMYQTAKMEVNKEHLYNPIMQDTNKDGSPRYYTYGIPFFNYGLIPQTWEDPGECTAGICGDNDPLDMIEIGSTPLPMGSVVPVKVLGSLELIDEGETDHKIIAIRTDDPDAYRIYDMSSLEYAKPGIVAKLIDWLKMYKTSDGKGVNSLAQEFPTTVDEATKIIQECHLRWEALKAHQVPDTGFYLGL